ncbi:hypothetical protein NM688_g761 [Phlebia brevispora]|uniref:Uncharacterized protein n=1 Tax=Phlebia brevispora TaxID=194682 RepID=A0ACC1TDQ6_9APHY|nr:hypothetical protein NM688_g761 [Phlebia brevispora]
MGVGSEVDLAQIISMQTLHYLTLAILIPPLLALFAESSALEYEGGAANVGMILDWRQMAGKTTIGAFQNPWETLNSVWSGGRQVGSEGEGNKWDGRMDPRRGWVIAVCWLAASGADIFYLYNLIRRPRLILDFVLTLVFNHLVLTTYYSNSIPTSWFFWIVMALCSTLMVIVAEQLCVRREMTEGLTIASTTDGDEMEMGAPLRRD